jgi:hypothetical protein
MGEEEKNSAKQKDSMNAHVGMIADVLYGEVMLEAYLAMKASGVELGSREVANEIGRLCQQRSELAIAQVKESFEQGHLAAGLLDVVIDMLRECAAEEWRKSSEDQEKEGSEK